MRVSGLVHLAARLVDVVLSRRLAPLEQAEVAAYLRSPMERDMFWGQPRADQRHGLEAARSVAAACPGRDDMIRAALLHDTGKRHARLGPVGRSWAMLGYSIGPAPTPRMVSYLEHGRIGADELATAGAEPLVVAYTRHHHGERPDGICAEDWEVLEAADRAFLAGPPSLTRRSQRPRPARLPPYDGVSDLAGGGP